MFFNTLPLSFSSSFCQGKNKSSRQRKESGKQDRVEGHYRSDLSEKSMLRRYGGEVCNMYIPKRFLLYLLKVFICFIMTNAMHILVCVLFANA